MELEHIVGRVKIVTSFCMILLVGLFGGCAIVEQEPGDVGNQLTQGLQGRGRIIPNDSPTEDSFGSEYQ